MKVTAIAILLFAILSVVCGHYRYGYRPYYKKVYKSSYGRPYIHHPVKVGYHGYGPGLHVASPGAHVAISGYGGIGNGVYVASNPGATHVAPLYG